jgi:hypothetical protein
VPLQPAIAAWNASLRASLASGSAARQSMPHAAVWNPAASQGRVQPCVLAAAQQAPMQAYATWGSVASPLQK